MFNRARFTILFCFALVALMLSPSTLSAHATSTYAPAVAPGNLAQYKVLYDSCQSTDPSVCQSMGSSINDTAYAALEVIAVSGPTVTLRLITIYKNGTGSQEGAIVDVATGSSNVTSLAGGAPGDYFVLAGNLQVSDHIWDDPSAPTFNSTSTEMVLDSSRSVNFLNYSSSFSSYGSSFSTSSGFAFDQASGVLIEVSFSITTTGIAGDIQISFALGMVDNNIWGTANLPDFGLSADPTTLNIVGSETGTSTISLTRSPGFSATVKLTATPSSSSVTCSLSTDSLAMGGSDTSTLSCAGPSGTYTVMIEGNGGYSVHDTSVTVSRTSNTNPAPTTTQPASSLPMPVVYGGIGVAAVVAALVAFLFLRRRPSGAVVAPGDAQAPATQA